MLDFLLPIMWSLCFIFCCIVAIRGIAQLYLHDKQRLLICGALFAFGCIIMASLLPTFKVGSFICTVMCIVCPAYSLALHKKIDWSTIDIVITTICSILLIYAVFNLGLGSFIVTVILELLLYLVALATLKFS